MLWYPAMDDPGSSINRKLIERLVKFHCSRNRQHTAPVPIVWPLIIGVLLTFSEYITPY